MTLHYPHPHPSPGRRRALHPFPSGRGTEGEGNAEMLTVKLSTPFAAKAAPTKDELMSHQQRNTTLVSAERKRECLCTRIRKFDAKAEVFALSALADELVQALCADHAVASCIGICAVIFAG